MIASGLADFVGDALDPQVQVDAIGLGAVYALMAVGIGLVFGVLRLVNFAYGQLIMAGAFALAFASRARTGRSWAGIALCFAVVIALSLAMERVVFRPLRTQSPAVMLVATFAVAFLLQSDRAPLRSAPLGEDGDLARLSSTGRSRSAASTSARSRSSRSSSPRSASSLLVAPARTARRSACTCAPRRSTSQTARLLGVRANRVIGVGRAHLGRCSRRSSR